MTGRVVAGVEQVGVASHVRVCVGGLHLVTEGVSVRKEQWGSITILALEVIVMELLHYMLTELKDREAGSVSTVFSMWMATTNSKTRKASRAA